MTVDPDVLAAARLSPPLARDVFRTLLDALAQPGRPYDLPAATPRQLPPPVVPALALADLEVRVGVAGADLDAAAGWCDVISTVTGAPIVTPDGADWLVALEPPSSDTIAQLPAGSALSPESGARLTIGCDRIVRLPSDDEDDDEIENESGGEAGRRPAPGVDIAITGPGVPAGATPSTAGRVLHLVGVGADVIAALIDKNRDVPAGVDAWLCADDGAVVGLPRSSTITVLDDDRQPEGAH